MEVQDVRLGAAFSLPLVAALLTFLLGGTPLRTAVALLSTLATLAAVSLSVAVALTALRAGDFGLLGARWPGVMVTASGPLQMFTLRLEPHLLVPWVLGLLAFFVAAAFLLPQAWSRARAAAAPLAALSLASSSWTLLCAAEAPFAAAAGFAFIGLAGCGLLVLPAERRVQVEGALGLLLLHRLGDLCVLLSFVAFGATFSDDVIAAGQGAMIEAARAADPWQRLGDGALVGFPVRTAWQIGAGLLVAAAATRLCLVPLNPMVRDATGGRPPSLAVAHAVCFVGAGVVVLVRSAPLLNLAPEVLWTLSLLGALTAVAAGLAAFFARDLVRLDLQVFVALGAVAALSVGVGEVSGAVAGLCALLVVALPLALTSGVVFEATGVRDPRQLGALEAKLPRTHTARLLSTLALSTLPLSLSVLERVGFAAVASPRRAPELFAVLLLGMLLTSIGLWRGLHLTFTGAEGRSELKRSVHEPTLWRTLPAIALSIGALAISLVMLPPALSSLLPLGADADAPLWGLIRPGHVPAMRTLLVVGSPVEGPPALARATLLAFIGGMGALAYVASALLFRGARALWLSRLGARLTSTPGGARLGRGLEWLVSRVAGGDGQVARGVGEGATRLSRLIAVNLLPGVLATVLERVPRLTATAASTVVRLLTSGHGQRSIVLMLLSLWGLLWLWGSR